MSGMSRMRFAFATNWLTWISFKRCSSRSSSSSFISVSSNFHTLLHTSHDSVSMLSTFCFFDAVPPLPLLLPEILRVNDESLDVDWLLGFVVSSLLLLSFDRFKLLIMLSDLQEERFSGKMEMKKMLWLMCVWVDVELTWHVVLHGISLVISIEYRWRYWPIRMMRCHVFPTPMCHPAISMWPHLVQLTFSNGRRRREWWLIRFCHGPRSVFWSCNGQYVRIRALFAPKSPNWFVCAPKMS